MIQTSFGRWTLDIDADATRTAYSKVDVGSPESCGCSPCLNFAAQRDSTFPVGIRSFMAAAGIPVDREAEIYHIGQLDSGLHSYGGWFHFVGNLSAGKDAFVPIDERTGSFDLHDFGSGAFAGISNNIALVNSAFGSRHVLQLEFTVEIPWAIDVEPAP